MGFVFWRRGQSLIEILIATAIGVLFILAAIAAVLPATRGNTQATRIATGATFAQELADSIIVASHSNWHTFDTLTTSTVHYSLNTSSSPFVVTTGDETSVLSGISYTRYFIIDDVYRDGDGQVASGVGALDPSTKKITIFYTFDTAPARSFEFLITRTGSHQFIQTDWSAGDSLDRVVTGVDAYFSTSTNVSYASTTGSITITGF